MILLGVVLAALVGLSLGLLGSGGSILTVPIFVYILNFEAKEAIAMSLAVVGITSLFGAIGHWRIGNVQMRVALIFGSVAMVGTFLGARLSTYVSGAIQLTLFAVVMLVAAYFMLRSRKVSAARDERVEHGAAAQLPLAHIVIEGLVVGIITGLVGVGGGFLVVPALVLLGGLPMNQAVGTSLLVIAMKSASGFAGYLDQVSIAWGTLAIFSGVAVAGILAGSYLMRFVPQEVLKRSFAMFLILMGVFILFQNREVLMLG
jgi:uncharacterized membrane protein YfcA